MEVDKLNHIIKSVELTMALKGKMQILSVILATLLVSSQALTLAHQQGI